MYVEQYALKAAIISDILSILRRRLTDEKDKPIKNVDMEGRVILY